MDLCPTYVGPEAPQSIRFFSKECIDFPNSSQSPPWVEQGSTFLVFSGRLRKKSVSNLLHFPSSRIE